MTIAGQIINLFNTMQWMQGDQEKTEPTNVYFDFSSSLLQQPANGRVGWARTKPGGLDSIPGRVTTKTWKTVLTTSSASCSALVNGGARKRFTRGATVDSPSVEPSLRKQPRGKQVGWGAAGGGPLVTFLNEYRSGYKRTWTAHLFLQPI